MTGKRASYREAIEWLALNDDNEWLNTPLGDGEILASVTAHCIADIFGKTIDVLCIDLQRELRRIERAEAKR